MQKTSQSTFLPAPYKGVNELLPKAVIASPYCETLLNFNPTPNGIALRYGDSIYSKISTGLENLTLGVFTYGSSGGIFIALKAVSDNKIRIYNADSGAVVYTSAAAPDTKALTSVFFDGTLFIFPADDSTLAPGIKYNGSAWAAVGYTGAGNFYPFAGNTFNHRQYMPQLNEAAYWYSPIDSPAAGTCIKKDLSGIFSEKCTIAIIASTTISDNISSVVYQAFISDAGEVLFYTGSYPDSDDWNLVGRAHIAQPIDYEATIPYNGDTLIMTDAGVVSLRDLFLRGSQQASTLTLSSEAQKTWTALIKLQRVNTGSIGPIGRYSRVCGVYDAINNRIVICFPFSITNFGAADTVGNGNFFFIFDNQLSSWFFHQSGGPSNGGVLNIVANAFMTIYKNQVVTLAPLVELLPALQTNFAIRIKEGRNGINASAAFMDKNNDDLTEIAYEYEAKLAPVPFKKDAVYSIDGVEVLIQSDLYAQTIYNLIADFGRQTTSDQKVDALTTSVQKPMVNIGITANFAQVKVSGLTVTGKTVGLTLYGFNVWFEAGEKGSR